MKSEAAAYVLRGFELFKGTFCWMVKFNSTLGLTCTIK